MPETKVSSYHSDLITTNGIFKVGMTKEQADKCCSDKHEFLFSTVTFKSLDSDKNGVLSQEEILVGRLMVATDRYNKCKLGATLFKPVLSLLKTLGLDNGKAEVGDKNLNDDKKVFEAAKNELNRYYKENNIRKTV